MWFAGKYKGAAHSLCNLRFSVPKKVPGFDRLPFYNKRISKQVCERILILWGNTEKYKPFSVPIEKEVTKIDKDGNARVANISYNIKFTGNARFLTSSLSILAEYESAKDNLRKYNVHFAINILQTILMKNLKSDLRTHLSFLIMMLINIFCCSEKG